MLHSLPQSSHQDHAWDMFSQFFLCCCILQPSYMGVAYRGRDEEGNCVERNRRVGECRGSREKKVTRKSNNINAADAMLGFVQWPRPSQKKSSYKRSSSRFVLHIFWRMRGDREVCRRGSAGLWCLGGCLWPCLATAVEAVEAALAGLTAEPAAAERGNASVEAAVALLLLLGRGGLLLRRVVHRLTLRRVTLGRVALIRGRVLALRGRRAVVGLLLVGHGCGFGFVKLSQRGD